MSTHTPRDVHGRRFRHPQATEDATSDDADSARAPEAGTGAGEASLRVRFQERYDQVQALRAEGKGMRTIGRELGLDRTTVRRFINASGVDELLAKTTDRAAVLDAYKPYLHRRWNDGCTNVSRLLSEIRERGYRGSARTVYRYLQPFRPSMRVPDPAPVPPKILRCRRLAHAGPEQS